jgi:hypothetical protein
MKMPFLVMCYQYCNEKHWYECNWPREFVEEWEDKNHEEYEIHYLIVCGQWLGGFKDFESIIKAMKG